MALRLHPAADLHRERDRRRRPGGDATVDRSHLTDNDFSDFAPTTGWKVVLDGTSESKLLRNTGLSASEVQGSGVGNVFED